ncbi:hypothetical protein UP10_41765 [Bradyrhizobium sp. LTSPM299]|uniref:hypothetical protein n=1 Tax=Bradyrhizobium sp. LTSPM299 TaxID=1619233 RepID=UPI0005CABAFF|nr:hypothetical protein [Bradyrhizobium sp. LTSPM299]KJC53630.1 hypothetical protein UP10_41765 [Bradyrhizobium sp. LTSPM299]
MRKLGITLFGLVLCLAVPAKASTVEYAFQFTGAGFSGSGDIFVNSQLVAGGYDITNITGSIVGPSSSSTGAITALDTQPGTPNAQGTYTDPLTGLQWLYNDVLYAGSIPFDNNGVLFNFGSKDVGNIYSVGTQLYLSVSNPISDYDPGVKIALKVAQTPLPASLPMFLAAIVGVFFVMRRKKHTSGAHLDVGHVAAT